NIERITKQKIDIAKVPTVADLRARRLEVTQAALREALASDENQHFRVVVDALSDEFDPVQVAMAAVRLYHQTTVGDVEDEEGIGSRAIAADAARGTTQSSPRRSLPRQAAGRGPGPKDAPYGLIAGGDMAKIYIGAGKNAGIRPQDLVGAIANEAGVAGGLIGAIQITDRFSLVEVPEDVAIQVIRALEKTTLRGKKVQVRRDKA
ncbi:MAG: DbpA RNA binding domain-containing protein, partial [Usitatibacter sp.]